MSLTSKLLVTVLIAGSAGYLFYANELKKESPQAIPKTIELPAVTEYTVKLDKYELDNKAMLEIAKVTRICLDNKDLGLEIVGHTDNVGSAEANELLSLMLANKVGQYFIAYGVDTKRLSIKGDGETTAVSDNSTEEGRADNRRVDIRIKAYDQNFNRRDAQMVFDSANSDHIVEAYLKGSAKNPKMTDLNTTLIGEHHLKVLAGWKAYDVKVDAKTSENNETVSMRARFFTNGKVMADQMTDLASRKTIDVASIETPPAIDKDKVADNVAKFLKEMIGRNPQVTDLAVEIGDLVALEEAQGWYGVVVNLGATVNFQGTKRFIPQSKIYFSNGTFITDKLTKLSTQENAADNLITYRSEFYPDENLIYGNKDAASKIAIFSDPLCPFCKRYVPKAIEEMRQYPEKFAIYYFHMPLEGLHPAAVALTKAAIVAEEEGVKDVALRMYSVQIRAEETDEAKILTAFNKTFGTTVSVEDIQSEHVLKRFEQDQNIAKKLMVGGTPTVYYNGIKDSTKQLYKLLGM